MEFRLDLTKLPFQPSYYQIIYVESAYNDEINQYIQQHYYELKKRLAPDYEFIYIPYLYKEIDLNRIVHYYAPYAVDANVEWEQLNIGSDYLLDFMEHPENRNKVPPSLVKDVWDEGDCFCFKGVQIEDVSHFDDYIQEVVKHEDIRFCLNDTDKVIVSCREAIAKQITADDKFNDDVKWLIRQTQENLRQLRKMGIGEKVLQLLFREEEKLSRLRITQDYRIFLPDYDMMEICMTPLPKAVYLLFLNHPEGINFSYLPDYFEELKGYYIKVRGKDELTDAMLENLKRVTNPTDNSINEKCARIKEAFIKKFDDHLACNYYISGKLRYPKSIPLPRELVEWK